MDVRMCPAADKKIKPKDSELTFGTMFTDNMFVMDYEKSKGWHDARIEPYAPFLVEPSLMVFHYAQAVFEGLKAYRAKDGSILTFRPRENFKRLNNTCERMCIPEFDIEFVMSALKKLLKIEAEWVPSSEGTSLYIRPFVIATDHMLGVRPSSTYRFFIILSPVGAYYSEGFKPVKIYVTDKYVRAAPGGVGHVKASGNYGASLYAAKEAKQKGFSQVLWLDAAQHKYIEEVGTMNILFKINGKIITPSLESGSILPGITRKSVIAILKDEGYEIEERAISIEEVYKAGENGTLEDVFGCGTAAVISPVGQLTWGDRTIMVNDGVMTDFTRNLYDKLTGIQYGETEDKFDWITKMV